MSPRTFALLGSGEFEPWHDEIDRWLLERAGGAEPRTALVVPLASAPEGREVFDEWAAKGRAHYERLGVPVEVAMLLERDDASGDAVLRQLDDASLVFFSGGNPWHVARSLTGTPFWDRLVRRLDDGLVYAGCSAGVACLTSLTFDSDTEDFDEVFKPGLGYVPGVLFGPHWDMIETWVPGAKAGIIAAGGSDVTVVGIDERTAMIGDGEVWSVRGAGAVYLYRDGTQIASHRAGGEFGLAFERSTGEQVR